MTNAMLLQDAMGLIDEAIIDKAANTYVTKRRVSKWPGIVAAAAAIIALVILIASRIHLPGAVYFESDLYKIYITDGVYSMEAGVGGADNGTSASKPAGGVKFTSLSEMRRIIFEGELSESAMKATLNFPRTERGEVLLFDPNNMQDIQVPEDMWVSGLILWMGYGYSFNFENDRLSGSLDYYVIDESQKYAEQKINSVSSNLEVLSETLDPERNAVVTVYRNTKNQRENKQIVYTHSTDNKTVTFVENYNGGAEQEVPYDIVFWGTENGNFFRGSLYFMTERLSLEYLMQFGLKPFEE